MTLKLRGVGACPLCGTFPALSAKTALNPIFDRQEWTAALICECGLRLERSGPILAEITEALKAQWNRRSDGDGARMCANCAFYSDRGDSNGHCGRTGELIEFDYRGCTDWEGME